MYPTFMHGVLRPIIAELSESSFPTLRTHSSRKSSRVSKRGRANSDTTPFWATPTTNRDERKKRLMEHQVGRLAIMTSEISMQQIHELAKRRIAVTFLNLAPARRYMNNLRI